VKACANVKLPCKSTRAPKPNLNGVQTDEFLLEGMMKYLLTWIAIDDQVRRGLFTMPLLAYIYTGSKRC
jgi:hypothetical protein